MKKLADLYKKHNKDYRNQQKEGLLSELYSKVTIT